MINLLKTKIVDKNSEGFTLIELIIVIAILGIIATIAIPRWNQYRILAEERVCTLSRRTVEIEYEIYLFENDHGENVFNQFLIENFGVVCPSGGVITHDDEKVRCSLHEEEVSGDEVPWL